MPRGFTLALLLLSLASVPTSGQVTAKQGEKRTSGRQLFGSPMVLEVPAGALLALERGDSWSFPDVSNFQCEDAWFQSIAFKRLRAGEGKLEYEVVGFINVADSYDRQALIRLDFLDSERIVGEASKGRIDAEERKTKRFWFTFQLAADAVGALRASSSPTLRLTLELK